MKACYIKNTACTFFLVLMISPVFPAGKKWICEVLPSEKKVEIDPDSGAKITFVTTNPSNDTNLYFHDRCWLQKGELMLFMSDRDGRYEIYGYVASTGELVRLNHPGDDAAGNPVASKNGTTVFVVKNKAIYTWEVTMRMGHKTRVEISEKKLYDFPPDALPFHSLNENADGSLLSYGYVLDAKHHVGVVNLKTGTSEVIASVDFNVQHVQFHWTDPNVLSIARGYGTDTANTSPYNPDEPAQCRIWFIHVPAKTLTPAFYQVPGELVTHECWWTENRITFIGGHRKEEAHVKVLDLNTNRISIIGAGGWLPGVEAKPLSAVNWWHASGSPDGRWVAADNWHGIIALFNAQTTRMHTLTTHHRTYGGGAHPHVGWDLAGKSVEFTSNKLGSPDVCIGEIPEDWLKK